MPPKKITQRIKGRVRMRVNKDGTLTRMGPTVPLAPRTASAVRAIAKSVVSKQAEDKFVGAHLTASYNDTISSPADCFPVIPQITVGPNDFQRIGDRVKGKYLYVKGMVQYGVGNAQYPPKTVRCLILSQKNLKTGSQVSTSVDVAHLLKDNIGTGTARGYTGTLFDNLAPINKDLFRVHMDRKFRFKLRSDATVATSATTEGTNPTRYFSCRIKLPTLTFDDGNANWPNNFAPFFCMGAVADDGSGPTVVGTPWLVQVQSIAYYEDS